MIQSVILKRKKTKNSLLSNNFTTFADKIIELIEV